MFKGIYVVGLKTMKRAKWSEPDSSGKGGQERALLLPPCLPLSPPQICWQLGSSPFLPLEADLCQVCLQLPLW